MKRKTQYGSAFRTYQNYVRAWRILTTRDDAPRPDDDELVDAAFMVDELAPLIAGEIGRGEPLLVHIPTTRDQLRRAWGTELLLQETVERLRGGDYGLVPLAAPWVAIQAYFAVFSATQALASLVRDDRTNLSSHAWVRSVYHDLWGGSSVAPWSVAVAPRPAQDPNAISFAGQPEHADPARTHPWGDWSRYDAWDIALKSLVTTLDGDLKDRYDRARANGKQPDGTKGLKTLPRSRKEAIRAKTHPYTLLDFLHRLRVRANYGDAGVYEHGTDSWLDLHEFMVDLTRITSATLLATELRIASLMDLGLMQTLADEWLASEESRSRSPLAARVNYLGLTHCRLNPPDSSVADEQRRSLTRAAAGGDATAMMRIGCLDYVAGDDAGAVKAFEHAAQAGHPDANQWLGKLARMRGDLPQARTWWKAAAERGNADAMSMLAQTQYLVPDELNPPDWREQARKARRAARAGDPPEVDLYDLLAVRPVSRDGDSQP